MSDVSTPQPPRVVAADEAQRLLVECERVLSQISSQAYAITRLRAKLRNWLGLPQLPQSGYAFTPEQCLAKYGQHEDDGGFMIGFCKHCGYTADSGGVGAC